MFNSNIIKVRQRVFIHENVTGNNFGEYGFIEGYLEKDDIYIVRLVDGLRVRVLENQIEVVE